jgi:hypothetical protein
LRRELTEHREIMTAVGSKGLVHEETMKNMKIFDDFTLARLKNWRTEWNRQNPTRKIPTSNSSSVFPHWLGVNSPEQVAQLIATFTAESARRKPVEELEAASAEADDVGELNEEDQWEKEDIDEIQAQRLIDDDTTPTAGFNAANEPIKKLRAEAEVKVHFGYLNEKEIAPLKKELDDLKKNKELIESDVAVLQSKEFTVANAEALQELEEELEVIDAKIEEIGFRLALKRNTLSEISKLLEMAPHVEDRQLIALQDQSFYRMSMPDRWRLYASWKKQVMDLMEEKEHFLEAQYAMSLQELKDVETLESAEVCRTADIIGITTTGAAKQRALLEHLKPKIGKFSRNHFQGFLRLTSCFSCGGRSCRGPGSSYHHRPIIILSALDSYR